MIGLLIDMKFGTIDKTKLVYSYLRLLRSLSHADAWFQLNPLQSKYVLLKFEDAMIHIAAVVKPHPDLESEYKKLLLKVLHPVYIKLKASESESKYTILPILLSWLFFYV